MENFPAFPDYILAFLFGLIIPFVSGIRSAAAFEELKLEFDPATKIKFYLGNSLFLVAAAIVILLVWFWYKRPLNELGFTPSQPANYNIHWWLMGLFSFLYVMDIINSLIMPGELQKTKERLDDKTPFMPNLWKELPAYMVMCVAAGVCEEIIFRGYMINFFKYLFHGIPGQATWAVVTPAAIFSIAHYYQGGKAVFKILVLSVLFGMIFWHSRSLYAVMILHFLVDFISGLLSILLSRKKSR